MMENRLPHTGRPVLGSAILIVPVLFSRLRILAAFVVLLAMLCGCSDPRSSKDYRAMEAMGEKLRAYVMKSLDEMNATNAKNVAIASSFFAREMECVAGEPPRLESAAATDDSGKLGLVEWSKYRERIESIILNPDQNIGGMTADNYESILGWALSEEDITELKAIRARHGYWGKLSTALKR